MNKRGTVKNNEAVKKPNSRDVNCCAHTLIQKLLARSQLCVRVCACVCTSDSVV